MHIYPILDPNAMTDGESPLFFNSGDSKTVFLPHSICYLLILVVFRRRKIGSETAARDTGNHTYLVEFVLITPLAAAIRAPFYYKEYSSGSHRTKNRTCWGEQACGIIQLSGIRLYNREIVIRPWHLWFNHFLSPWFCERRNEKETESVEAGLAQSLRT